MNPSTHRKTRLHVFAATATATIALCSALPAIAQEAPPAAPEVQADGPLDRVVVTARKREENLDDVPISVSVLSGDQLESEGIVRLDQAVQAMPGVSVTPTPVGDLLFVRGIGSGENQGFEMSVATFVDGVHFGRGRSARHAFLDVNRIEVLKGPQPILFGKNTIGGAFNITSNKPTDEFEGYIEEYIEPEFGTFQTTGMVSGPITDTLRGRLVLRSFMTDGYMNNSFRGTDEPERNDWVGRGTLAWTPTDDLEITFKGEYGEGRMKGGYAQISRAVAPLSGLVLGIDPDAEFVLDYNKSGPGTVAPWDREFDDTNTYNSTLNVAWDIGDFTLTSVSSYVGYDVDYAFDSDFTPLNLVHQTWDQHWSTWAQEFRLDSPANETFEYTVGFYYSTEKFKNGKRFSFNFGQTPLPFPAADRVQRFVQETEGWSAFAQGTWHMTSDLSVVAGVRHTVDEKDMYKQLFWANPTANTPNPALVIFPAIGLGTPHEYIGVDRSTDNNSFELTLQYQPDEVMYYASYKQGFKAGGFDEGNATGVLSDIMFDDESANSYEAGLKGRMLDGALVGRVALFHSTYDDLQVSIFDGVASLIVGNAAESSTTGLEVEGQWAVNDKLVLSGAATYLDAKYESYVNGPCSFGLGASCNLSGRTLPYSPDLTANLGARWEDQFVGGWTYVVSANAFYSDAFSTAGDLDPRVAQDAFTKIDASVTFTSPDDVWSFSLIGKNLTDEVTSHFGDDIPLSNILGNNYQQYVDPPRTIAIQARYQF